MHRPTVGIISLVLLLSCAALWIFSPPWDITEPLKGATLRLGLMMGALWLALPQLEGVPGWMLKMVSASAMIIAVRPRAALLLLPLLLVYLITRPRHKRSQGADSRARQEGSGSRR